MSITMRNGNSSDFVPSKMRRAEISVLNDTRKVHVGMGDGTTEELVTKRVIEDAIQNTNNDIINELTTKVNVATTNANTQGTYAKTQGDYAKAQGDYAKQQGDSVRDSVAPIINTNLQASYSDKASGLSGESIVCNVADNGLVNVTRVEGITEQVVTETSPSIEYPSEMKYANNFEIKTVGKNLLLNSGSFSYTNNGVTFTRNADKSVTINGTSTAKTSYGLLGNFNDGISRLKLNNVPHVASLGVSNIGFACRFSNGEYSSLFTNSTSWVNKDMSYVYIEIPTGATFDNVIVYPQIEQGTVATSYETYIEDKTTINLPMRSLPNGVKDTIEYVDGKLYHVQRVKENTLDGSSDEEWVSSEILTDTFRFVCSNAMVGSRNAPDLVNRRSDKFMWTVFSDNTDKEHIRNGANGSQTVLVVYINKNRLPEYTTNAMRNWVAVNPLTINYELATPILTPLSDIYLKSFATTTHLISTSSPQVRMAADFKSELWSRDYSQDVLLSSTVNKNTEQDLEIAKKFNKSDIVSSDTINDANKVPSSVVTNALGKEIDFLTEKTQKIYNYASGLSWYTHNMSTTEFFNAMPSFTEITFMVNASSPISDLPQAIGIITIIKGVNNNHGTCEYTSSVSNAIETYVANFSYVGFSGWRKILHESNKGELLHGLYTTAIPSGSDLNTYSAIGEYYSASTDVSLTLLNCPHTTSGFKLTVEYLSSSAHLMQTIKAVNGGGVYYRYANSNNGWIYGNWVSVFGRERNVTMNTTYLTNLYTSTEYNPLQSKVGKTVHVNGNFNVHTTVPATDSSAPTTLLSGLFGAYRHRWIPITRMQNGATYWLYLTSSTSDTGSILRSSTELPLGNYYIDISYIAN